MLTSKHKPNTLNFKERSLNGSGQFTPSTPTVISILQDLTPTNYGYSFDNSDKDEVLKQFSMHYKSIEDSHKQEHTDSLIDFSINANNSSFTLDLLTNDYVQSDLNIDKCSSDFDNLQNSLISESTFSSDAQSCFSNNESNSSTSQIYADCIQSAKKRERNRLAAEKCRLKKQGKLTELENEKKKRLYENNILMEKIKRRTETIKKLKNFYKKLQMGEFKSQSFY